MSHRIDLNCDMGESFGAWKMGDDTAMLDLVSSANIACGFHAGDPEVIARTVEAARARGVAIGAHPSFMDLYGFGRRRITGDTPQALKAQQRMLGECKARIEEIASEQLNQLAGAAMSRQAADFLPDF